MSRLSRILVFSALVGGCSQGGTQQTSGPGPDLESKGPKITVCGELPTVAAGTCEVTPGGPVKLIRGTVLLPGEVLRGGSVAISADGKIACAACDCAAQAAGATTINCPTGVISPGLINTHDHITYAQNEPAPDTGERYEHRHDWRRGLRGHTKIPAPGGATTQQVQWGELRFLLGGATSTVGSGSAKGVLRNLDKTDQEGLSQMPVDFETFPLGDSDGDMFASGCNYSFRDTAMSIAADDAYEPHISEGIDAEARNEFVCASMGANDLVQPNSAFIHAIGLKPADYAKMALDGTSIVWSPRSNVSLYGDTAQVAVAARAGVNIALGTDWILSGSMNMLRELQCADSLNKSYYSNFFSDEELWLMATRNAALATATDDVIGTLAVGKVADIAIFVGSVNKDHRAILAAEPKDVVLVLRAGKTLYGDAAVVAALGGACSPLDVCGAAKSLCLTDDIGMDYEALKSAAGSVYPAFFCGVPMGEPSCAPTRPKSVSGSTVYDGQLKPGDADGDGITDANDNCPRFFNPIRPVDEGAQGDADKDGTGDVCDPCPLEANVTRCAPLTVPPEEPPPMLTTASIYDIKSGVVAVGKSVTVARQLVTGVAKVGFFLQVKEGDPGFDAARGAKFGGIWVHQSAPTVTQGQRVTVSGKVTNYFGQIQLDQVTVTVDAATPEALPAPTVVNPADVATGGALAKEYEGALLAVENVAVTDVAPSLGAGDKEPSGEFAVEGGLRIDDFIYAITPFPTAGVRYTRIVGVLTLKNENTKLEPRSAADVTQ